ncbi:MAG: DMT family transporter [Desulfobulbaceae bacterium]|nr:DMT family transporter [Desulfobulbaceae bacterium]
MYLAEFSALAAALCWSCGGLFSTTPARTLGAVRFNRLRLIIVSLTLIVMSLFGGGWQTLNAEAFWVLSLSSIIGILIGDTLMFATLKRLGPRRTGIIFGLLSALCQAISLIIARPIMATGVDALSASALRVGISALALIAILFFNRPKDRHLSTPLTGKLLIQTGVSGIIGMALGVTFLLFALTEGEVGLVSTLSATSPIFILPILWIATRERPASGAWVGAFLAVFGIACIFLKMPLV